MKKKANRAKRVALAKQQAGLCLICGCRLPGGKGKRVYEPEHNAMICWECSAFRIHYNSSLARGVTPLMLTAYEAREPQPEPTVQIDHTKAEAKKHKQRLRDRHSFAVGKHTFEGGLAAYDSTVGHTGPVMHPSTGQPIELMDYAWDQREYGAGLLGREEDE